MVKMFKSHVTTRMWCAGKPRATNVALSSLMDDEDEQQSLLAVVGYSCSVYRDDEAAIAIDKEEHMLKWMEDDAQNLWIDRYDVRALVDDSRIFVKRKGVIYQLSAEEEEEERMLDELRYMDLPPSEGSEIQNFESSEGLPTKGNMDPAGPETAMRVHYTFPAETVAPNETPIPQEITELGHRLGLNVDAELPRTRKQHQVIEHTARFIHKHGHKMEAMLKVKHGGNPAFAFLLIDNTLQPYYQAILGFLKSNPEAASNSSSLLPPEDASDKGECTSMPGSRSEVKSGTTSSRGEECEANHTRVPPITQLPAMDSASKIGKVSVGPGDAPAMLSQKPLFCGESVGAKKDETQTPKRPPPEMMMTIEKLVEWIGKSGLEFEGKVKERQRGDPRFEFLHAWNPYNAYYRWRLQTCLSETAVKNDAVREGAVATNGRDQDGCLQNNENIKSQAAGEDEKQGAARRPDEEDYNPHAITVVKSITSFGGEDSSEEEKSAEDAEPHSAQAHSGEGDAGGTRVCETGALKCEERKRRTRWEDYKVATGEEEHQGRQPEEAPAPPSREDALSESERKAARLLRAKMLAQRLQAEGDSVPRSVLMEKQLTGQAHKPACPPSYLKARSNSRSRSRSRSAPRNRSHSVEGRNEGKSAKRRRRRSRSRSAEVESRDRSAGRARRSESPSRSRDRSRERSRSRDRARKSSKSTSKKHSSKHRSRKHKKRGRSGARSASDDDSRAVVAAPLALEAPSRDAPGGPGALGTESARRAAEAGTGEQEGDAGAAAEATPAAAVAAATLERLQVGDDLRDKVRAMLSLAAVQQ